jgi:hypothetical protein
MNYGGVTARLVGARSGWCSLPIPISGNERLRPSEFQIKPFSRPLGCTLGNDMMMAGTALGLQCYSTFGSSHDVKLRRQIDRCACLHSFGFS